MLIKSNCVFLMKIKFHTNTHLSNMSNLPKVLVKRNLLNWIPERLVGKGLWKAHPSESIPQAENLHSSFLISVLSAELSWKAFSLERSSKGIIYFLYLPVLAQNESFSSLECYLSVMHSVMHRSSRRKGKYRGMNLEKHGMICRKKEVLGGEQSSSWMPK